MDKAKLEAQKQWDRDPCGASAAGDLKEGSLEFFEAVKQYRYYDYAPWMHTIIGFDRFVRQKVLEIGPGLGTDLLQFASQGAQTYAVDLSRKHLELTQQNLGMRGYEVPCLLGDAEGLPFRTGIFDCVYAFGVLHHTPQTELAVAEIYRVLKDGGKAIVSLYHRDSAFYWIHTIFLRGILLMGLLRKGYRRLLSEIEVRSGDSDAIPLVKVYSRKQVLKLFGVFKEVKLQVCHLDYAHFLPLRRVMSLLPDSIQKRESIERFGQYFGWYLIVQATK